MLKSEIRILLADDHPLMLEGLHNGLSRIGYDQITKASNGDEVIKTFKSKEFDVAILDIEMPKLNGFQIVEYLRANGFKIPVIFLSYHKEKRYLILAKKLGIKGYLLKEDGIQVLHHCIQHVLSGKEYFSPSLEQEIQKTLSNDLSMLAELTKSECVILKQISLGLTSAEIADQLKVSKRTIQNHRTNINQKLEQELEGVSLMRWAVDNRILIERI